MGTLQTFRKAYGALKDTTKVGLAHVNSDYAVLLFCSFCCRNLFQIAFDFRLQDFV